MVTPSFEEIMDSLLPQQKQANPFSITVNGAGPAPTPAPPVKAPAAVELLTGEEISAIRAVREVAPSLGLKEAREVVKAVVQAINAKRLPDPKGTLRREPSTTKYAFAIDAGKYLLIDTKPWAPAYKIANADEAVKVKSWALVVKGSG